jgi:uncharacterized phiE125 gp8 family phage protein
MPLSGHLSVIADFARRRNGGHMYKWRIVVPPAEPVVDLATLKQHLRIIWDYEDDYLEQQLLPAAERRCEAWMKRSLAPQTLEAAFDGFVGCGGVRLARPPLIEVESVTYIDAEGVSQAMDLADVAVDTFEEPGMVFPLPGQHWPTTQRGNPNAVKVRYRAGYESQSSPVEAAVPADLVAAVLLTAGDLYENRESTIVGVSAQQVPLAAERLMDPYRVFMVLE